MPSSNITPHAILTIKTKIDFYAKKLIPVSYAHFLRKAKCDKYLISGSLLVVKNKKNLNVKSRANENKNAFSPFGFLIKHEKNEKKKIKVLVAQPGLTLCDPMYCSSSGYSVHGIL